MNVPNTLLRVLLDAVWPECCLNCRGEVGRDAVAAPGLRLWDRPHLCGGCLDRLAGSAARTEVAGIPVAGGSRTGREIVALVGAMKYHGVRGLAAPLGALMADALRDSMDEFAPEVLVPVPLHRRRKAERGFNQAELLASVAGRRCGLPVRTDVVKRIRGTGQQAKVANSVEARAGNVAGAFRAKRESGGGRIVIIDDIVTTGSTVLATADALRAAGWTVVGIAAVGAAVDPEPPS